MFVRDQKVFFYLYCLQLAFLIGMVIRKSVFLNFAKKDIVFC